MLDCHEVYISQFYLCYVFILLKAFLFCCKVYILSEVSEMFVANLIRIKENKKISIFAEKTKKISFFEFFFELYVQISLLQTSPRSPTQ